MDSGIEKPAKFSAPWGWTLVIVSMLASALCLWLTFARWPHDASQLPFWSHLLPLAVLVGAALFTVRGYTVTEDAIRVQRLLWTTRLPLEGLVSATVDPDAMKCAMRTCGNGGFYSFTGWHWSKRLGAFRAFVTDLRGTVVLRYLTRKTVVLSPGDPEGFVEVVMERGIRE